MAQPPRTATAGTFFVTALTLGRRRRFNTESNARALIEILQHYRTAGSYKLHAFVVMPDHIHLLLTTADLPRAMKEIKGAFGHRMGTQIWQRGYTDHRITTREEFTSRRDYIHNNPVRAGLCHQPENYPYSSAAKILSSPPPC